MRVLILGVNGFIGNALTRRILTTTDWEVFGLDVGSERIEEFLGEKRFRFLEGDISINREWIEYHVKKCDVVLPLVAIATPATYVKNPLSVFELDFEENLRIIKMAGKYGKRVVFPSTSEVYGMCPDKEFDEDRSPLVYGPIAKPRWIYSASKQLLDRVIAAMGTAQGLQYTLFRPFNWYGPHLDNVDAPKEGSSRVLTQFLHNILYGVPIKLVDGGSQRRCFTYIEDGIDGLMTILENPKGKADGEIFNLGNPAADLSIEQLAHALIDAVGDVPEVRRGREEGEDREGLVEGVLRRGLPGHHDARPVRREGEEAARVGAEDGFPDGPPEDARLLPQGQEAPGSLSRLALKVDVDTYRGTLEGVPRLLDLFAREGVKATFFFSLGPDTSGKAIKRIFRKGFVKKVLSASPAASYGVKTMLYGTLLPAPDIGGRKETVARMREAAQAGHSVGIHAWDHIDWHDHLPRMSRAEIEAVVSKEHARFLEIFGAPAAFQAAPGWTATPLSVEVQEAHGILATSDTRGGGPFHALRADGTPSKVLEIPSTLPTLDELLALPLRGVGTQAERACEVLRMSVRGEEAAGGGGAVRAAGAPGSLHVHSIHTEIEGAASFAAPFASLVAAWKSDGVTFLTFEEICRTACSLHRRLQDAEREQREIPVKALGWTTLPGRATPVATGVATGVAAGASSVA